MKLSKISSLLLGVLVLTTPAIAGNSIDISNIDQPMLAIDPPHPSAYKRVFVSPAQDKLTDDALIIALEYVTNYQIRSEKFNGAATMDYRPISSTQINPAFSSGWGYDYDNWIAIYNPLLKATQSKDKNHAKLLSQAQELVKDYFDKYLQYAPKANYSFLISPYYEWSAKGNELPDYNEFNSTFLFIDKDLKVSNTKVLTKGLVLSIEGEILVEPNTALKITPVDWQGITHQSGVELIIRNNSNDLQPLVQSLVVSMNHVLVNSQQEFIRTQQWEKERQEKKKQQKSKESNEVKIEGNDSGVQISGGSIVANKITITGNNIVINNSNLKSDESIDLNATNKLTTKESEFDSPILHVTAQQIDDDGSLAKAQNKANLTWKVYSQQPQVTQMTFPRLFGFNQLAQDLVNAQKEDGQFKSQPVIPLLLAQAVLKDQTPSQVLNTWTNGDTWNNFLKNAKNFVEEFGDDNYLASNFKAYIYKEDLVWKTMGLLPNKLIRHNKK